MKDFDGAPQAIERQADAEQKKHKFQAEMVSKPGLTLWEYDEGTKVLSEAKIKEQITQIDKKKDRSNGQTIRKVVVYRKNCLYFQALNKKNAMRHLAKMLQ